MADITQEMSDEEFMNSQVWDQEEETQEEATPEPTEQQESEVSDDVEATAEDIEETDDTEEEQEDESTDDEEVDPELTDGEDTDEPEEKDEATDDAVDYETEYKKLFQPFRANGRDMQIESIDDAVQLMKMGAGFNKKMSMLKPNLKLLKMLDNNGLLDESKLGFLIDLDKKNPDAIKKLVSESEIDQFDLDDTSNTYKPTNYTVHDKELELSDTLENISGTPSFKTTIDVVNNKWDESSRSEVVQNPAIIEVINDHVATGIYDQINTVIERERMLGRLQGVSDIAAYRQIGDRLHAEGKFDQTPTQQTDRKTIKTPATKSNPAAKKRKQAAASTKSLKNSTTQSSNLGALSDEEFDQEFSAKYL